MVERLRGLGLPGVTARTFHAHALSQLRYFWPSRHDGAAAPRAARLEGADHRPAGAAAPGPLPVHAGQGPRGRDRVGEVPPDHAARVRGRGGGRRTRAADPGRPVRADLRGLRAGEGARRPDGLRRPAGRARSTCWRATRRPRRRSAPASAGSASTSTRTRARSSSGCSSCGWASRRDLCVVGDEDQTIYTFTGATSSFLTAFAGALAGGARSWTLVRNYRSTPQVLALANRLLAAEGRSKRLEATRGDGPEPHDLPPRVGGC